MLIYLVILCLFSYRENFQNLNNTESIDKMPEIINNIALLIPVYPPHYPFVYNILNKLKNNKIYIDTYLIFSNDKEYNIFEMKDMIIKIIPESVPDNNSIINFKKLYGLKYMSNTKYDYIILCDSESDIIPENFTKNNMTKKMDDTFTNNKIYGIKVDFGELNKLVSDIMITCANTFTGLDYIKIENATKNLTLFTNFYNTPVYKREHIQGFLDKINYNILNVTWHHFDTLIYDYYLIAVHNFQIIDITDIARDDGHGMYVENTENFYKLKDLGFGFGSAVNKFWKLMENDLTKEGTFLLVNIDRPIK